MLVHPPTVLHASELSLLPQQKMIERIYSSPVFSLEYIFANTTDLMKFKELQKDPDFSFYMDENGLPLYDEYGTIKYRDVKIKSVQTHLVVSDSILTRTRLVNQLVMDEYLFVRIMPANILVQISGIRKIVYRRDGV